jgi:hypothetical protein
MAKKHVVGFVVLAGILTAAPALAGRDEGQLRSKDLETKLLGTKPKLPSVLDPKQPEPPGAKCYVVTAKFWNLLIDVKVRLMGFAKATLNPKAAEQLIRTYQRIIDQVKSKKCNVGLKSTEPTGGG